MATFRGRVGIAVLNNTLLYATGGAALAEINSSLNISGACPCFTSNSTRWGWVAGGGIEYRFAQNWTARVEALYSDFGTKSVAESSGGFVGYVGKFKNTVTQARVGLNYKW
jgi:outer membrane immunogenic protein